MKAGAYRRALRLAIDEGVAVAEMEDDVHHFRLTLRHDGERLCAVKPESLRTPWATCAGAEAALQRLVGSPLVWPIPFPAEAERFSACTHTIDLANLAIGRIGEIGLRKRYDIEITPYDRRTSHALLLDEGGLAVDWRIEDGIVRGDPCDGTALARLPAAIAGWAVRDQEPLLALRRAVRIGGGRHVDLDDVAVAGALSVAATCYSLLPGIRERAFRNRGNTIDFWAQGRLPLGRATSGSADERT